MMADVKLKKNKYLILVLLKFLKEHLKHLYSCHQRNQLK